MQHETQQVVLPQDLVPSPAILALAQASPPTGESVKALSAAESAGAGGAGGADASPAGGMMINIILLGAVVLFVLMTVMGGRRERKKFEAMLNAIKKNDSVRTVGGIIGSVVEVKPDVVVLKIDENSNTKITVARSKIEAVLKESVAN